MGNANLQIPTWESVCLAFRGAAPLGLVGRWGGLKVWLSLLIFGLTWGWESWFFGELLVYLCDYGMGFYGPWSFG
jgi:hypothetical protein